MEKLNNKKNILITAAGGSSSIYFAKKMQDSFNIFLVDASADTPAKFLDLPFSVVPFGNHPDFEKEVDKLIDQWSIDWIVSTVDKELLTIKKLCNLKDNVQSILPSKEFIELCLNKKKLMVALGKYDISHLLPFQSLDEIKYPAMIKPPSGTGSREVHIVNNRRQVEGYLKLYQKNFRDLLIQPYIEGQEFTVSVIVNNFNSIIGIVPKRVIVKRGITRVAVTETNQIINRACETIVKKLEPSGPFNVQLKFIDDQIFIFEINPRLSTTAVLTEKAFGDEIKLCIDYFGKKIFNNLPQLKSGVYLYRYEENIFSQ